MEPGLTKQGSRVNRNSAARGGEAMASSSNWLSGVNVVLVMAYGSLVRRSPTPFLLSRLTP